MTEQDHPSVKIVRDFLTAMQNRDLDAARAYLAPGFTMVFPGGVVMHTLEELIAWSQPRYRRIEKIFDAFEVVEMDGGTQVYCIGTLVGEKPDGAPFSDIRFIDRVTVKDGQMTEQLVWNDLAEVFYA